MSFWKNKKVLTNTIVIAVSLIIVVVLAIVINNKTVCVTCHGDKITSLLCETCGGTGKVDNRYFGTFAALLPPIIAIVLALVTKEVYSSLFVGILSGALFNAQFNPIKAWDSLISDGFISSVGNPDNAGILIFMVILGMMVALVNKAGGAQAFGRWAKTHIKTRIGAQVATFILGIFIFIDDYFNCLTVGSVMKPICERKKISAEKLAYIIDATAAPICMIAPISSWAAAVSSYAADINVNGIKLFCQAIPFNFYSLLTIVFVITMTLLRVEFGPMKKYEDAAMLFDSIDEGNDEVKSRAKVIDLLLPIIALIGCCVCGMLYSGEFFTKGSESYMSLITAFGNSSASFGLCFGSLIAIIFTIIYLICRKLIDFESSMGCLKDGFIAMVPAILVLCFAWTLNTMTGMLGAKYFIADIVGNSASSLQKFLPAVIFLVACGLSFATGTSWGTFGILIPIVLNIFPATTNLGIIGISACLAGAVCGDHCSPISDTTIMASAGADCIHLNHVSTQLPYVLIVAAISFVMFILAGFVQLWFITLPIGIALTVGSVFLIKYLQTKKSKAK